MSTHSPAPWRISGSTLYAVNGPRIARIEPSPSVTVSQDLANRALIEAAPSLAEHLARALTWMETYQRFAGLEHDGPLAADVAATRDLLAKLETTTT